MTASRRRGYRRKGADSGPIRRRNGRRQAADRLRRPPSVCIYLRMLGNSREIVNRLKAEGYELVYVKGSHHKFRKGEVTVVVPHPKKDLPLGTVRSIARRVGWI